MLAQNIQYLHIYVRSNSVDVRGKILKHSTYLATAYNHTINKTDIRTYIETES